MTNAEQLFKRLAAARLSGGLPDWIVDPTNFILAFTATAGGKEFNFSVGMVDGRLCLSEYEGASMANVMVFNKPYTEEDVDAIMARGGKEGVEEGEWATIPVLHKQNHETHRSIHKGGTK